MLARIGVVWERVAGSLWALPVLVVALSAVAAIVAVNVRIAPGQDPVWWLYSGSVSAASGYLASLLTTVVTMTTLAVSITMVVLTLAAQALGPLLISTFMGDTATKLALGLFFGTGVYLLIALRSVVGATEEISNLAVTGGVLLALISLVVLLFFVHRLARSTVAETIIERVGRTLDHWAHHLLPETSDDGAGEEEGREHPAPGSSAAMLYAERSGYIQAIAHRQAVGAAARASVRIALDIRPGDFVLVGDPLGRVWPREGYDEDADRAITTAIVVGSTRTQVQDVEYAIRQLVEIAVRALSQGINDPYTACSVIDRLAESIAGMMDRGSPVTAWRDDHKVVRLTVPEMDFDSIVNAAFDQIRQNGAGRPAVMNRLAERLVHLHGRATGKRRATLRRHLDLVENTGLRAIPDEADRAELTKRIRAAG